MELSGGLFSQTLHWWAGTLYAAVLLIAIRNADWRRLSHSEQLHVFLGACVVLLMLWQVRAQVDPAWSFHLLGVTALTLMFGWSFAIIGSGIVLIGVNLNAGLGWDGFFLNAIIVGVVPITLTQFALVLARAYLPRNFFVYVLVNAFLTAGFAALASGYLVTGLLIMGDLFSLIELKQNFLPFFPLMFLPEAMVNGWIMTILVLYRPNWVGSFSDEIYLKGK
jgi:uncharacterized membrane protein